MFQASLIHCVGEVGLKLLTLLSLPPNCWDYRFKPLDGGWLLFS